jgi:hypothetical protein
VASLPAVRRTRAYSCHIAQICQHDHLVNVCQVCLDAIIEEILIEEVQLQQLAKHEASYLIVKAIIADVVLLRRDPRGLASDLQPCRLRRSPRGHPRPQRYT